MLRKFMHKWWLPVGMASAALVAAGLSWLMPAKAQPTIGTPFQTTLSVTTSATTAALAYNPSRKGLIICNGNATGTNNVYVGFGANIPTVGTGLVIPGGLVVASCWYALPGLANPNIGVGAQIHLIATATTNVTLLEC